MPRGGGRLLPRQKLLRSKHVRGWRTCGMRSQRAWGPTFWWDTTCTARQARPRCQPSAARMSGIFQLLRAEGVRSTSGGFVSAASRRSWMLTLSSWCVSRCCLINAENGVSLLAQPYRIRIDSCAMSLYFMTGL